MSLIVRDAEQEAMLSELLRISVITDVYLRLYTNDVTPTCTTVASDFTECADASYVAADLVYSDWSISTTACVSQATYGFTVTFSFAADATLYGYYITSDSGGTTLIYSERFTSAPITISAGGSLIMTPEIQMGICVV